jgi:hypothetical protein
MRIVTNVRRTCVLALAAALLASGFAHAQNPVAEAQVHQREATQAYQAGDYEGFTRSLEIALELNPASFATRYNLACGYARTGRDEDALNLLEELTKAKVDFGMARDPDLATLRDLPKFQELVALLEEGIEPISNSSHRLTIDQYGLIPEGIAIDSDTGRMYFGSMRSGDIYVVEPEGGLSKFATVRHEGKMSAIGMTVDRKRNLLWSIGTSFFMGEDFDAEAPYRTGVFGFDLATGELKESYLADESVQGLNDVVVAQSGDLYLSGTVLHILRAGAEQMEPLVTTPALFGSNGITMHPDGTTLIIASYPVGVGTIDLESGALRFLESPEISPLYGIDGLYWHDGDLVGIQNGIQPWRLMRITLNDELTKVSNVRVIEFANDAITPTTGAIVGNEIHYVGRAPSPEAAPSQFPATLAPFIGKTVIMTAPLD